jgi:hypothetical protein
MYCFLKDRSQIWFMHPFSAALAEIEIRKVVNTKSLDWKNKVGLPQTRPLVPANAEQQPSLTTMASRCLVLTPKLAQRSGARFLSTTRVLREEASTSPNLGSVQPQKKPVGGFRGG